MLLYWLWFSLLPNLSAREKLELLERFSDPEDIYRLDMDKTDGLTDKQRTVLGDKDLSEAQKIENICARKDIGILAFTDERYPERLRHIYDPPFMLYYKGTLPDFNARPSIGVVGTRKSTAYGLHVARKFGSEIAACGGIVVSGGAKGGDAMAHQGAMEAGGYTVAVLGNGVDIVYPTCNRRLFMDIEKNGCLISEYIPGDAPERWHFPERNRIISGLSNAVLVTEAPDRSGALITARDAAEQGKDVFVVPGNVDMPTCEGSNALLRKGAVAVFSGWDILSEYQSQYPQTVHKREVEFRAKSSVMKVAQPVLLPNVDKKDIDKRPVDAYSGIENMNTQLSAEEKHVLSCLDTSPKPVDDVIAQVGAPAASVLSILTKLALKGVVINHPGRLVSVRKQ